MRSSQYNALQNRPYGYIPRLSVPVGGWIGKPVWPDHHGWLIDVFIIWVDNATCDAK